MSDCDFDSLLIVSEDNQLFVDSTSHDALKGRGDTAWRTLLDVSETGSVKPTLHNVRLILENDLRTKGLAQRNLFTGELVQRCMPGLKRGKRNAPKPIKQLSGATWQVQDPINGDLWTESRDAGIREIIEAPKGQGGYGLKVSDRDLKAALDIVANGNAFHPVREYFDGLLWDGVPRLETFLVRYIGAADIPYTRQAGRLVLLGAVTRIFEPGAKFDFVLILEGKQGRRKSTFISTLAKGWFAELEGNISDRKAAVEKMQGCLILEIPELSGFSKAEVQEIKAMVSAQSDKVRLSYARRAAVYPRQCVYLGSTNDLEYLRDQTGGRRFWPMPCKVEMIDTDSFSDEVDQLWAEAVALYRQMREIQPAGTLPLFLADDEAREGAELMQESRRVETAQDAMAGEFAAWLDSPISSGSFDDDAESACRVTTCLLELWTECLGRERGQYDNRAAQQLGAAMRMVDGWQPSGGRFEHGRYGRQRVYRRSKSTD